MNIYSIHKGKKEGAADQLELDGLSRLRCSICFFPVPDLRFLSDVASFHSARIKRIGIWNCLFYAVCTQLSRGIYALVGAVSADSFGTIHSYTNTYHMPFFSPWFPEKVSCYYYLLLLCSCSTIFGIIVHSLFFFFFYLTSVSRFRCRHPDWWTTLSV